MEHLQPLAWFLMYVAIVLLVVAMVFIFLFFEKEREIKNLNGQINTLKVTLEAGQKFTNTFLSKRIILQELNRKALVLDQIYADSIDQQLRLKLASEGHDRLVEDLQCLTYQHEAMAKKLQRVREEFWQAVTDGRNWCTVHDPGFPDWKSYKDFLPGAHVHEEV